MGKTKKTPSRKFRDTMLDEYGEHQMDVQRDKWVGVERQLNQTESEERIFAARRHRKINRGSEGNERRKMHVLTT